VKLKIWHEEKVFHVAIPNPAAKRQFPEWQAEPIPQKRRVGELDLVLRGITASPTDDRPELSVSLEVLHEGRPSQGLEIFPNEFVVLDATGNTGVRDRLPPFSEPVWMIRTSVVPVAGKYPIPATEGMFLGPVVMPEAGHYTVIPVPEAQAKTGLRYAALLGPGWYRLRNSKIVSATDRWLSIEEIMEEMGPLWPESYEELLSQTWMTASVPMLFMITAPAENVDRDWQFEEILSVSVLRMKTGPENRFINFRRGYLYYPGKTDMLVRTAVPIERRETDFFKAYTLSPLPGQSVPPPGVPVEIQIVPHLRQEVEFLVAPPALPAKDSSQ
jgi:hypothetical protein